MSAVGSKKRTLNRHCETTVFVQGSQTEKRKDVTDSVLFQRVLELMLNHCTLGRSQGAEICAKSPTGNRERGVTNFDSVAAKLQN